MDAARRHPETGEWIIPEDQKIHITQKELAAWWGVSISSVARWVRLGIIPTSNIDGRRRIRRDLVQAWLDEHSHAGHLGEIKGVECPYCGTAF